MATLQKITTPAGSANWAKLITPDTKFKADGEYKVNLLIREDAAEALTSQLDKLVDIAFAKEVKRNPKLKAKLSKRLPYQEVLDDEGNETGELEFKFKLNAVVNCKDGSSFSQKPALYDAKGKPLTGDINVGNGSKIKVAFEPVPYMMASTKQVSLSLRMKAVQIIDLQEYQVGGGAESYGFSEEEGYEATQTDASNTSEEAPFDELDDIDF